MEAPPKLNPPNWLERNWRWFVPTLVISVFVCFAAMWCAVSYTICRMTTSTDVYQLAVAEVQSNALAKVALGEPVSPKWRGVTGHIDEAGTGGHADMEIGFAGSKQDGMIYLQAHRKMGEWHFDYLVLQTKGTHERITLVDTNSESVVRRSPDRAH